MKKATQQDKQTVTAIFCETFKTNPTIQFMIKHDKRASKRIAAIAEYAFDFAFKRNGVFISDNGKGVAICYQYNYKNVLMGDFLLMLKMVIKAIHFRKVLKVLLHDSFIKKQRPEHGNYLYFWFFGVLPEEQPKTSARDLTHQIFKLSDSLQLPIYAETTIEKNKRVYQHFGFRVYKTWVNQANGIKVWFMLREPELQAYAPASLNL
ncbi:MAG: hypothetical protein ACKVPJ_11970 [Chitinophagales bacterium]